jgi:hypothetical protein
VFGIVPEDLSPDYSPPRDLEERLYYDRAKGRKLEGLARALGVSMDERTRKVLALWKNVSRPPWMRL